LIFEIFRGDIIFSIQVDKIDNFLILFIVLHQILAMSFSHLVLMRCDNWQEKSGRNHYSEKIFGWQYFSVKPEFQKSDRFQWFG